MNSEDCSNGIMIFKTTEHLELKDCVRLELFSATVSHLIC